MVDDPTEQAFLDGERHGKKLVSRVGFIVGGLLLLGTYGLTALIGYGIGRKAGTAELIAAEFIQRAVKYGYEQGARDALNGSVTAQ